MLKTRIVTLALAALLAIPAVSASAKVHHRRLTARSHAAALLRSKAHRLHHVTRSRSALIASRSRSHRLSSTKHHALRTSASSKLHISKMPPTIDNL
jgi:hypothetical protein